MTRTPFSHLGKPRKAIAITVAAAVIALSACGSNNSHPDNGMNGTTPPPATNNNNINNNQAGTPPEQGTNSPERDEAIQELNRLRAGNVEASEWLAFLDAHLATLPPEDADQALASLLDFYDRDLQRVQARLDEPSVQAPLASLDWPITDSAIEGLDEEARTVAQNAVAGGYKLETAEGMIFAVVDYGKLRQYNPYISDEISSYIDVLAMESDERFARDAALSITWDQLGERTLAYEKYVAEHPDSPYAQQVEELYLDRYLTAYLYGLNNTPNFDGEFKLLDEARTSYESLAASNPNTITAQLVQGFLDVMEQTGGQVFEKGSNNEQVNIPAVQQYREQLPAKYEALRGQ